MEGRMLWRLTILLLLAGSAMAVSKNDVSPGTSGSSQQAKEVGKQKSIIERMENYYYSFLCTMWGMFPISLGGIPLKIKFLKERIVKVGPAPSCANLILRASYSFPSSNEIKKLKESKIPVMWIVGGPGSGKGTFCKMMSDSEGYTHISVGDLIRAEVSKDTNSLNSQLLASKMKGGELVPEDVALTLLIQKLLSDIDTSKGFLIDGFPRSFSQAKSYQNKIKPPDAIIYLKVSDEIMKERALKRNQGRTDDNEETIKKRLQVFHQQQGFVTSNKMFASKVKEVNAEGELNDNFQRFSEAIHESIKTTDSDSQ